MSDQEINIAIAELCRWRIAGRVLPVDKESATACWIRPNGHEWQEESLPDFCNDLNAMHEEIMSLEGPIRDHSYRRALAKSVGVIGFEDWEHSLVCLDKLTNATARQRAEAFLRTLGKWKETK
jgi:hypothetical protein